MDTSKWYNDPVYIKMCEKATDIQKQNYHIGCIKEFAIFQGGGIILDGNGSWWYGYEKTEHPPFEIRLKVWLPRQDDLQDMISDDVHDLISEFDGFVSFPEEWGNFPFASLEQLWLAFVMKEKYNKVWNGEDWIVK